MTKKILFIEDERVIHLLLDKYIEKNNIDYFFYKEFSIIDSLEQIKKNEVDLIVSDYYLSDGNAFDIVDKVNDIPIILITGSGNEELAVNSIKLGFFDYVVKDRGEKFFIKLFKSIDNAFKAGKSEIQIKKFINNSNLMILSLDKLYNIVYVNNRVCRKLKIDYNSIIKKNFIRHFLAESDQKEILEKLNGIFRNNGSENRKIINGEIEMKLLKNNKNILVVKFFYTAFRNEANEIIGILLSGEDITNQKEIEKLKNDFLSMISHEIKNPITVVKGLVDLMINSDLDKEKSMKYLNIVQKEFIRLEELTNDYLEYQNLERGSENFNICRILLNNLLDDVYIIYKDGYNCDIEIQNMKEEIYVLADYNKLKQVIINLISNSIKYSKSDLKIDIILDVKNEFVNIAIKDNGIGIPKEDLPKLFDKYYRVRGKEHGKIKGSGLGLAISKEIIKGINGEIFVESELDKWSKFTLRIPLGNHEK
ncbi:MAG: ATP-binding protein [Clostridiales bacterium]